MGSCNQCGNKLRDGAKFCPLCGAPVTSITPEPRQQPLQPQPPYQGQSPYPQPAPQPHQQPYPQPYQQPYSQPYQRPSRQSYPQSAEQPFQQQPSRQEQSKKPVMPIILGAICGILLIVLVVLVVLAKPWDSGDKNSGKEPSSQVQVPVKEEAKASEEASAEADAAEEAETDAEESSESAENTGETEEGRQEESSEEISKPEEEEAAGGAMENSRSDIPDATWSEAERQIYYQAQYEDIVETYRLFYNGEISIFDRPQMFQNGVMGRGMYSAGYWTDEDGYCQASDYEEIHMVYLIQDLNLDRIPELVVAEYSKDYDTYLIHDLWTIVDNQPVFVDYSDARFDLKPMMEGYFYRTASSGAAYTYFYVYRLSEEGILETVESASMEENVYTVNGETVDTVDTVFMFNDTWSPSVIDISTLEWKYLN